MQTGMRFAIGRSTLTRCRSRDLVEAEGEAFLLPQGPKVLPPAAEDPSSAVRRRDSRREAIMRFGVFTSLTGQVWSNVLDLWRHLEAVGWDIACVSDHFMPNSKDREGPVLESWSALSALSALIPRMKVGTIVLGNTYRYPAVV